MTIKTLEQVNSYLIGIKNSPLWTTIIEALNDADVDYTLWSDIQIVIWALRNNVIQ